MLSTLFYIAIGCLVGWNFPQPEFAKNFQAKYLQSSIDKFKNFISFLK